MRQLRFIRSNTFLWASVVAAVFAVFMVVLFGFVYWRIDAYLIARSDRMIHWQLDFIAGLPQSRRIEAITDHLGEDLRGVQFIGLFDATGDALPAISRVCPRVSRSMDRRKPRRSRDPLESRVEIGRSAQWAGT